LNPYLTESPLPYLVVCGLAIFFLYQLGLAARKLNLVDKPNVRKFHEVPMPVVGGLSIFLAASFSFLLFPFGLGEFRYLLFSLGLLIVIGVLDDHSEVSPYAKVTIQLVVAVILVGIDQTIVTNIGDIFGWNTGNNLGLTWLAYPLTVIAIVGTINAFNMIDGHDGLAGMVFLLTIGSLMLLCQIGGIWKYQYFLGIYFVATTMFLCFNLRWIVGIKKQVFLGDAGSMLLGLLLVYFLITMSEDELVLLDTTSAPWLLGLPLFDMLSVMALRLQSRESLIRADRKHMHHLLSEKGFTKLQVLSILVVFHMLLCAVGVLGTLLELPDTWMFWSFIVAALFYIAIHYRLSEARKL